MRGGCARRIFASSARDTRLVLEEVARCGLSMGSPPAVVCLDCDEHCAGRCQVAVALCAVAGCDRLTVPDSGARCRGPKAGGFEALHDGRRGGVAIDRHERRLEITRITLQCQARDQPSWFELNRIWRRCRGQYMTRLGELVATTVRASGATLVGIASWLGLAMFVPDTRICSTESDQAQRVE